jgi:hypothetical protein
MKHSDFHIDLEFMGTAGFWWRCTDIGTRTITAIQLDRDDPNWYRGPRYIAEEVVFDEHEIAACHLSDEEAIRAAIHEHETSGHPGFPHEDVMHMMEVRYSADNRYPHKGVLRFDRRRQDGEILHPFAGRQDGEAWTVLLYLSFLRTYGEMPEHEFIALPIATADYVGARADRQSAA